MPHHPQVLVNFPDRPDVLDLGFRRKKLHSPYRYTWEQDGQQIRLTAPAGFIYNGASVPQIVWSIYPPHALDKAAVFHDLIYRHAGFVELGVHQFEASPGHWVDITKVWTRNAADTLFFRQLNEDPEGPNWFSRQAAYRAVRIFGGGRWG